MSIRSVAEVVGDIPYMSQEQPKRMTDLIKKHKLQKMPEDFRITPQVRKVFELLVEPHEHYVNARIEDGWGLAQKRSH